MNPPVRQSRPTTPHGPIAGPIVSDTVTPSPLASGRFRELPSGNSGAPEGTTTSAAAPRRIRLTRAAIDAIAERLSERDRRILRSVEEHQFLSVRHIETLHFSSIAPSARGRIARRVLRRLRDLRVLGTLDRRIGGTRAGSRGLIYHVGIAGDRLLDHPARRSGRLRYDPSGRFVEHRLAVAETHVALIEAHRCHLVDVVSSAVEPSTWRTYVGIGSARRTLKPDLFAETATGDLVHAWFIEIDMGTEHLPTLLRKCRDYEAYRQTGIEQDRHGAFPIVIWSMTHPDPAKAEARRQALADALGADSRLPGALFKVAAPDDVLAVIRKGGTS